MAVTDDLLVEGDESVALAAAFVQSSPRISLVSNTAAFTITDNDCKYECVFRFLCDPILSLMAHAHCVLGSASKVACAVCIVTIQASACYILGSIKCFYYNLFSCSTHVHLFLCSVADVLYGWENSEYKVVEDSGSLAVNLCLTPESGTLTFPIEISITSIPISATGI